MASNSQVTKSKRAHKLHKAGRKRKRTLAKRSTLSYDELFAPLGPLPEKQADK